jgi:hypothetical protein
MKLYFDMLPRSLWALFRLAWARLRGYLMLVSEDEWEGRLDECMRCPFLDGQQCGKCHCFVEAKTWVATESCPQGRWPAIWVKKKLTVPR